MKLILILMAWGLLTAQNLLAEEANNSSTIGSQYPKLINQLDLSNLHTNQAGKISVRFEVSKAGKVRNIIILDTFDTKHNNTVFDAVNKLLFTPALQNGIPVKVSYFLPITVNTVK
jgi:hypothetical protein